MPLTVISYVKTYDLDIYIIGKDIHAIDSETVISEVKT